MRKVPDMNAVLLSVPIAAKRIGISHHLIRKWVDTGIIPAIMDRHTLKIHRDIIEEWILRIKNQDFPPEMDSLSENYRMTSFTPPLKNLLRRSLNTRKDKVGVTFDEYFNNK